MRKTTSLLSILTQLDEILSETFTPMRDTAVITLIDELVGLDSSIAVRVREDLVSGLFGLVKLYAQQKKLICGE